METTKTENADLENMSHQELKELVESYEKKLAESKRVEAEFVNASYDGYWDWYFQDDYEYMSPRFWEILGYDYKEKKHHPSEWQDMIFPEDLKLAQKNLQKHIEEKGKHRYEQEVRYYHKNGSTVTVLCRGRVVSWDNEGNPLRMIGTHTDITKIKELESLLKQELDKTKNMKKLIELKNESLEKSYQELKEFSYVISHDLQAPFRHISAYIDLLAKSLESKLNDEEMKYLKYSAHQ